jgi:hypothetical protein
VENLLTTVVLAFSMSADAFAAALGKRAALDRPRLSEALRTGVVFGTIEAITPITRSAISGVFSIGQSAPTNSGSGHRRPARERRLSDDELRAVWNAAAALARISHTG